MHKANASIKNNNLRSGIVNILMNKYQILYKLQYYANSNVM